MAKNKKFELLPFWIASFVITILTLVYQKATGPTYDKQLDVEIHGKAYDFDLPRSYEQHDAPLALYVPNESVSADLFWRKFPTNDDYTQVAFERIGDTLKALLPEQDPAGKLQYYLELHSGGENAKVYDMDDPVVIRFKGHVPIWVLRIHIFLMFAAMFLSNMAGVLALRKHPKFFFYSILTLIFFFFGGMILGPIVQKYAFGVYWSGVPLGWDLTDNKVLISFLVWLIAVLANIKRARYWICVIAAAILIVIYAIPHSTMGSERDPETGKLGTSEKFMD